MTPAQALLVKTIWAKVMPMAEQAAAMFYDKLFELDPATEGDMHEQRAKLTNTINTVVNALDQLEAIIPAVQALGKRHVAYGVKDEDYDTVGTTLLWTLERCLGEAFTEDVKNAWVTVYGVLAIIMKEASAEA